MIFLVAIIATLVASSLGEDPIGAQSRLDAEALCLNRGVKLQTVTHLQSIARQLNQAGLLGVCPKPVSAMIVDLSKFLRETEENICSKEAATRFVDYYTTYIDQSQNQSGRVRHKAPKKFRKFVLALGMQMSNKCKRHMLDVLIDGRDNLLNPQDVARFGRWVEERGPLGQMLASMNEPGEVILPADLATLMSRNDLYVHDRLFIQSKATRTIKNFKEICEKRFQPIYEPLVLPISLLSGVGFNYRDEELKADFEDQETRRIIGNWTSIVFICESLKFVEPVEFLEPVLDEDQSRTDNFKGQELDSTKDITSIQQKQDYAKVDKNQMRLLSKDEAEAINSQIRSNPKLGHLLAKERLYILDRVKFDANSNVPLGDLILDSADGKLTKAISNFADNKTKMDRIKGRMIRRSLLTLRSLLKQRKLMVVMTSALKVTWKRMTTRRSQLTNEEVNKMLIGAVEQMSVQALDAESKWTTNEVVSFVVVLICSLAALALTTWAVYTVVAAFIAAIGAIFTG